MDLLGPHVHSRHGLQFDVFYSSSLPSLCRDLCGLVPELWELWLNCMVDDGGNDPSNTAPFSCPALRTVTIKDRNLKSTASHDSIEKVKSSRL
jgi:hypothetical protein